MADVSVINVTSLTPIVAAAIVSGQQVTIYDQGGIAYRAPIEDVVAAAQKLNACQCIINTKLDVASADVLTLFSNPIPFGITVPAGYYAMPISAQFKATYAGVTYTTNTVIDIQHSGTGSPIFSSNALAFTADVFENIDPDFVAQLIEGSDLYLTVRVGNPAAGTSDITVYVTYTLIEL